MDRKRIFIYFGCFVAIVILTIIKQGIIVEKRSREVVSAFSEWQTKGRPVVVEVVKNRDIPLYAKITVSRVSDNDYEGYVPKMVQMKLQVGQPLYVETLQEKINGKVVEVGKDIDITSGMFPIKISFEKKVELPASSFVVYINTDTIFNVLCVPNEVITQEGDDNIIWIVRDGKAYKQPIIIAQRDGYGSVVQEGLKSGDLVIVEGFTLLYEANKVNIINKIEAKEI